MLTNTDKEEGGVSKIMTNAKIGHEQFCMCFVGPEAITITSELKHKWYYPLIYK